MLSNNKEHKSKVLEYLINDLMSDNKNVNPILVIMARQFNGEALYRIGKLYYAKQTKDDYLKAFEWFKLSYHQDYSDAICQIGQMYQYGKGVSVDHEIAMAFYQKAAVLENASAKFRIGCLYHYGIGRPTSYDDAFQWYSNAANQNNGDAQNSLGYLYEKGQGVFENLGYSMYWYEKGAKAGNERAILKVEEYKKRGIATQQPFRYKSKKLYYEYKNLGTKTKLLDLDQNQEDVLKKIKSLMIHDTSQEQLFTKKLESLIMEKKFRLF